VPTRAFRPYSIGCFRGCPLKQAILRNGERITDHHAYDSCRLTGRAGTTEDYIPYAASAAREVYAPSNVEVAVPQEPETEATDPSAGNSPELNVLVRRMLTWFFAWLTNRCGNCSYEPSHGDHAQHV
jgi:hypothetical protein